MGASSRCLRAAVEPPKKGCPSSPHPAAAVGGGDGDGDGSPLASRRACEWTPSRLRFDPSERIPTRLSLRLDSDSTPTPIRLRLDSDPAAATVMATAGLRRRRAAATVMAIRLRLDSDSSPIPLRSDSDLDSDSTRLRSDSDSTPTRVRSPQTTLRLRSDPTPIRPRSRSETDSTTISISIGAPLLCSCQPFLLSLVPIPIVASLAVPRNPCSFWLGLSNSPSRPSLALRPCAVGHGLAAASRRRGRRPAAWRAPRRFAPSSGRPAPRRSAPGPGRGPEGGGGRGGSRPPAAAECRCGRGCSRPPAAAECRCCARLCKGPAQRPTSPCSLDHVRSRCSSRRRQSQGRRNFSSRGPDEGPQRQECEEEGFLSSSCSFSAFPPLPVLPRRTN